MRSWQVQGAKARFSELLEGSLKEGPQVVTRRGAEAAVLVPVEEWRRPQKAARPRLKELLLARRRGPRSRSPGVAGAAAARPQPSAEEMYLLGTNIVSELRRPRPHAGVVAWLASVRDTDLHLSAIALGELQAGVELTREQDPAKAAAIEAWIEQVEQTWNVLPMEDLARRAWARLMHRRSDEPIEDAMIAATAMVHNLIVVTRNQRLRAAPRAHPETRSRRAAAGDEGGRPTCSRARRLAPRGLWRARRPRAG